MISITFFHRVKYSIVLLMLGIFFVGWFGFLPSTALAEVGSGAKSVPILLYHHIKVLPDKASPQLRRWNLTPQKLEEHLKWIEQNGFHTVTMAQLSAHLKRGEPLPLKPVVLTFDDGWSDHYTTVFPALKKYNFVATFFVTTDSVDHSDFVSWEELQEMSEAGMDIEPHSRTHPHLERLTSVEAFKEIVGSKEAVEQHLNKPALVFAYPFGGYNTQVINIVKRAGFESAASVSGMNHGYTVGHPYTLSRYAVTGEDTIEDLAWELLKKRKSNQ